MTTVPPDPLVPDGIAAFGRRLRGSDTTVEATTRTTWNASNAWTGVSAPSSTWLPTAPLPPPGRLMLCSDPVSTWGPSWAFRSRSRTSSPSRACRPHAAPTSTWPTWWVPRELSSPVLRRAGCVFLGKVRTTEFAMGGAGGVNYVRGTPWNPWTPPFSGCRARPAAAPAPPRRRACAPSPWAPTPEDRGAGRPPSAASTASRPRSACGRRTVCSLVADPGFDRPSVPLGGRHGAGVRRGDGMPGPATGAAPGPALGPNCQCLGGRPGAAARACIEAAYRGLAEAGVHIEPLEIPELEIPSTPAASSSAANSWLGWDGNGTWRNGTESIR